jgi:hypothetical protein
MEELYLKLKKTKSKAIGNIYFIVHIRKIILIFHYFRNVLVNFDSIASKHRIAFLEKELSSRLCPFFSKKVQRRQRHIEEFLNDHKNQELWFHYFQDLHDEIVPLHIPDPDLSATERKKLLIKINHCKNKIVMCLVRALVCFFNKVEVDEEIPLEDFIKDGSWLEVLKLMKMQYQLSNKLSPMLAALVWSVYKTEAPYYGHTSPFRNEIQKTLFVIDCEEIATKNLNPNLTDYTDVVLKIWQEEKKKVAGKKKVNYC